MTPDIPSEVLINITVPVPTERVADFYRMFSSWLSPVTEGAAVPEHWRAGLAGLAGPDAEQTHAWTLDDSGDLGAAREFWTRLSDAARTLLMELLKEHEAEQDVSIDELAARLGTDRSAITGTLSWPVRIAKNKYGFPSPIIVTKVADGIYCKLDADAALVLRKIANDDV